MKVIASGIQISSPVMKYFFKSVARATAAAAGRGRGIG